ncbi:MAG: membrane protein insertase YidC [Bradymonadia bacterium]
MNENTDYRRMILAVVMSGVVLALWTYMFPQQPPPKQNAPDAGVAQNGGEQGKAGGDATKPDEKPAPKIPVLDPSLEKITGLKAGDLFNLELSNLNGALKSWSLTEDQYLIKTDDGLKPDRFVRPLGEADDKSVFLPPQLDVLANDLSVVGVYDAKVADDAKSVSFTHRDATTGLEIVRTWRVSDLQYVLDGEVTVRNTGNAAVDVALKGRMAGLQNDSEATGSMFTPPIYLFESLCQEKEVFHREMIASVASDLNDPEEPTAFANGVQWAAVNNRYFMMGMLPGVGADPIKACEFFVDPKNAGLPETTKIPVGFSLAVTVADFGASKLEPGQTLSRKFQIYGGPKKYEVVSATTPPMSDAVDFGWFTVVSVPMLKIMRLFFSWVGNWGIAIVLLTILVKLLTLPLTQKQYKSMASMKKIQPQMKALQAKYKEDKLKQQQEIMKLYKEHNVNPLAGCLPVVLMMPIYLALYRTIYSSVELYQADLGGWIHDLSQPDPFYILPLALGGLMFLQSRLSPTAGDQAQQKIIMYLMPVIFTLMMLFLPAGLVLYIAANTIMGLVQQYVLLKKAEAEPAPSLKKGKNARA